MDQDTVDQASVVLYAALTVVFAVTIISSILNPSLATLLLAGVWVFIIALLIDDIYGSESTKRRANTISVHGALFGLVCIVIGLLLTAVSKDPNLVYSIGLTCFAGGKLYEKYSIVFRE